jgi:hypothetical protein
VDRCSFVARQHIALVHGIERGAPTPACFSEAAEKREACGLKGSPLAGMAGEPRHEVMRADMQWWAS